MVPNRDVLVLDMEKESQRIYFGNIRNVKF